MYVSFVRTYLRVLLVLAGSWGEPSFCSLAAPISEGVWPRSSEGHWTAKPTGLESNHLPWSEETTSTPRSLNCWNGGSLMGFARRITVSPLTYFCPLLLHSRTAGRGNQWGDRVETSPQCPVECLQHRTEIWIPFLHTSTYPCVHTHIHMGRCSPGQSLIQQSGIPPKFNDIHRLLIKLWL